MILFLFSEHGAVVIVIHSSAGKENLSTLIDVLIEDMADQVL